MTQYSEDIRNNRLASDEVAIGPSPHYKIFDGPLPVDCAAADSGVELVNIEWPADWQTAPAGGAASLSGAPQSNAVASGLGRHFRLYDAGESTCHVQGLVSEAHQTTHTYALGVQVNVGGNVYACTSAGDSGAASPPAGVGAGIADGTVAWDYVGPVSSVIQSVSINAPMAVIVTQFDRTAGNG